MSFSDYPRLSLYEDFFSNERPRVKLDQISKFLLKGLFKR